MSKAVASHDVDANDIAKVSELAHLLEQDTTPWWQKKNLRGLYICLIPAALGVEMTSGYDGSVLNGLQAVQPWQDCMHMASEDDIVSPLLTTSSQISTAPTVPCWVSSLLHSRSEQPLPCPLFPMSTIDSAAGPAWLSALPSSPLARSCKRLQ